MFEAKLLFLEYLVFCFLIFHVRKKKYLWRFSESFLFFVEFEKFFSVQENIFVYMSEAKWPERDVRTVISFFPGE